MCTNCNNNDPVYFNGLNYYKPTTTLNSNSYVDASQIVYSGADLTCTQVSSNTCLEDVLQSIDTKLCETTGSYTGYNFNCLSSLYTITNEAQFVYAITNYSCSIKSSLDTFVNITFPSYQSTINNQFNTISNPGLNSPCGNISYNSSSTLNQTITAISSSVCSIYSQIAAISTANWNSCYTVSTPPTTLQSAFNTVLAQICDIKTNSSNITLPTFDNTGTCLPGTLTSTDTLVDTVTKIRTKLCTIPVFTPGSYTASCLSVTSSTTVDQLNQLILSKLDVLSKNILNQFSSDFTVTNIDNSNLCLGKKISLTTPLVVDRFVASTSSDTTPGTLQSKLQAGTNVSLDYSTTPGKVIINSTASGSSDTFKVKVDNSDSTEDYLSNKVTGDTDGIVSITATIDTTSANHLLKITPNTDVTALVTEIINVLNSNTELKTLFCQLISTCPSPCGTPTSAQATPA